MLLDANENRLTKKYGFRHTLAIRRVGREDFGNYSCSAENDLGRARAFVEVSGEREREEPPPEKSGSPKLLLPFARPTTNHSSRLSPSLRRLKWNLHFPRLWKCSSVPIGP